MADVLQVEFSDLWLEDPAAHDALTGLIPVAYAPNGHQQPAHNIGTSSSGHPSTMPSSQSSNGHSSTGTEFTSFSAPSHRSAGFNAGQGTAPREPQHLSTAKWVKNSSVPPHLQEHVRHTVRLWMNGLRSAHQDPFEATDDMDKLSLSCGIHVSRLVVLMQDIMREEVTSANDFRFLSPPAASIETDALADKSVRKQQAVDRYVNGQRDRGKVMNPPVPSPGGLYGCLWPGCPFAHHKKYDWERHVRLHWPDQVHVCDICLTETQPCSGTANVFVAYRRDKLGKHIKVRHPNTSPEEVGLALARSVASVPNNFDQHCAWVDASTGSRCGTEFDSMKACLKHYALHLESRQDGTNGNAGAPCPLERQPSGDSHAGVMRGGNKRASRAKQAGRGQDDSGSISAKKQRTAK